ncbi:MAG: tRNA dihydrouridine synthase [Puniceicoccaceae bacterium]
MLPWFDQGNFPLYLAPMAGFTDTGYREICKALGADVMVTEFVMANSLLEGRPEVWETLDFEDTQRPVGIQIFGSDPQRMAAAAQKVVEQRSPDFLDLNFGCPSEKVTCQMAGASLLKDLSKLGEIARAVRRALPNFPVTAKIRIGWDHRSIVAVEAGKVLQDAGMEALAVHGRTRRQGYQGDADIATVCQVADALTIPVIANGSVEGWDRIRFLHRESACAGAMIGRAALGYPWIFQELKQFIATGEVPPPPTSQQRWETLLAYAYQLKQRPTGQRHGDSIRWMISKLLSLTKGMRHSKRIREDLRQSTTLEDLVARVGRWIERDTNYPETEYPADPYVPPLETTQACAVDLSRP